jgi:MFS transporter, MHS family, shikimate and dehydroshikimate transport protein
MFMPASLNIARRSAFASLIGTCIELYDFYIYATAAAIAFNTLFFPTYDAAVGTMLSFATFAIGAIMRPLGGMVCGHLGDRVGRKSMLVFTLVTMGASTFAIGLLPTYGQVGVLAPIMLIALRMIQGFAFGGEWGGAVLMSVEHAPAGRRGFYGSFTQMGSPIALFLSTWTFAALSMLPQQSFLAWGWRIPFLASAVLVIVGMIMRLGLVESPEFAAMAKKNELSRQPVSEVFRDNWRAILVGTGVVLSTVVAFYVQTLFVVSYATQTVGIPRQTVLNAVLVGSAFTLLIIPIFAILSDHLGRKPVALFGALVTIGGAFPFFALVRFGTFGGVTAAICMALFGTSALYAVLPAYVSELFKPRVRYSGISISYNLASGLIGGFSPAISSALFAWAGSTWPIALYLMGIGLVSAISLWIGRRFAAQENDEPQLSLMDPAHV